MNLFLWKQKQITMLPLSQLFDETDFYPSFVTDLLKAKDEVLIESPFITSNRIKILLPIFQKLLSKKVNISIVTRYPEEHEPNLRFQAETEIHNLEEIGISIIFCAGNHHRKLAIIDRKILWEGSLNILSHYYSREIMRRIESEQEAQQMFSFLKLDSIM